MQKKITQPCKSLRLQFISIRSLCKKDDLLSDLGIFLGSGSWSALVIMASLKKKSVFKQTLKTWQLYTHDCQF